MKKEDYIKYWKTNADKDWKRVNLLFKNHDFVFALFCAHLTLEKLLKAHWVKDNFENHLPKIHNLVYLLAHTNLNIAESDQAFLEQMNLFQIEGRYPDYQNNLHKAYNSVQTKLIISKADKIRKWLLKGLS